jgi:hypothetical protein
VYLGFKRIYRSRLRLFALEYVIGRLERGYIILSGRNCFLVKVDRRAPVEISKSISILLYFVPALRIPIAIPLWYGDN